MPQLIDFTKSARYTLSIRLSTDGFSFSVYDPTVEGVYYYRSFQVRGLQSMAANVKAFLQETPEFDYAYKQIDILLPQVTYTAVPLDCFEDEQMETLYYQNLPRKTNELILCNVLSRSSVVILFAIDKLIHVYLSEKFPSARFFASVSPQIEYLTAGSRLGNCSKLYANVHTHSLDVFGFDKGKLLLLNTYSIQQAADRLYYLSSVWRTLGFDQENDELHLAGIVAKKELAETMRDYVRKVFLMQPMAEMHRQLLADVNEIPFDMQTLLSCE